MLFPHRLFFPHVALLLPFPRALNLSRRTLHPPWRLMSSRLPWWSRQRYRSAIVLRIGIRIRYRKAIRSIRLLLTPEPMCRRCFSGTACPRCLNCRPERCFICRRLFVLRLSLPPPRARHRRRPRVVLDHRLTGGRLLFSLRRPCTRCRCVMARRLMQSVVLTAWREFRSGPMIACMFHP
jgi:hypothetical protein